MSRPVYTADQLLGFGCFMLVRSHVAWLDDSIMSDLSNGGHCIFQVSILISSIAYVTGSHTLPTAALRLRPASPTVRIPEHGVIRWRWFWMRHLACCRYSTWLTWAWCSIRAPGSRKEATLCFTLSVNGHSLTISATWWRCACTSSIA